MYVLCKKATNVPCTQWSTWESMVLAGLSSASGEHNYVPKPPMMRTEGLSESVAAIVLSIDVSRSLESAAYGSIPGYADGVSFKGMGSF